MKRIYRIILLVFIVCCFCSCGKEIKPIYYVSDFYCLPSVSESEMTASLSEAESAAFGNDVTLINTTEPDTSEIDTTKAAETVMQISCFETTEIRMVAPTAVKATAEKKYEMVSGYRRKQAFELASIEKIPSRIVELIRDEAILAMVDSNLQREVILPSEKAKAYKMRLDAMKIQGQRTDLTSVLQGPKSLNSRSNKELAVQVNEIETQIKRYIRLNELNSVYTRC